MTKYDYLNNKKNILSPDGKTPSVIILPGFNPLILVSMGEQGFLTGEALQDYKNMRAKKGDL